MSDFDVTDLNALDGNFICDAMHYDPFYLIDDVQNQSHLNISSIDETVLFNCPPRGVAPEDLHKVIGNFEAAQNVKKYYVSELIGIKPGEQPYYNIFPFEINNMPSDKKEEAISFGSKFFQLIYGNDLCDKQGIKYIGKYLKYYCPNSANYNNLNADQVEFIDYLFQSNAQVMTLAKKWANCK